VEWSGVEEERGAGSVRWEGRKEEKKNGEEWRSKVEEGWLMLAKGIRARYTQKERQKCKSALGAIRLHG